MAKKEREEFMYFERRINHLENIINASGHGNIATITSDINALFKKFDSLVEPKNEKFKKVLELKCPQCESVDDYYIGDNQDTVKCRDCTVIFSIDNNHSGWKDLRELSIEEIISGKYIIQRLNKITKEWNLQTVDKNLAMAIELFDNERSFRYKLKPLESIRITQKMLDDIKDGKHTPSLWNNGEIESIDGRKIEIIE